MFALRLISFDELSDELMRKKWFTKTKLQNNLYFKYATNNVTIM